MFPPTGIESAMTIGPRSPPPPDASISAPLASGGNEDEPLLLLLTAASFVEATSDVYACNLRRFFAGDEEISTWLESHWEPEELRHGRLLRAYVGRCWPEFDWQRGYEHFLREYKPLARLERLEASRGLEMIARCVVETGTAILYRAIHDYATDPTLKSITWSIHRDEVSHYKHFYKYFRRYQSIEANSRRRIMDVLARRTLQLRSEDADVGMRHAAAERYAQPKPDSALLRKVHAQVFSMLRKHYPLAMAHKMLLKPLALPPALATLAGGALALGARGLLFRQERLAREYQRSAFS